jgi:hypothetical protein
MNRWLLPIACSFALLASPGVVQGEPAQTAPAAIAAAEARLAGDFRFAELGGERAGRKQAIERSVDKVFFAVRGVARGKLEDKSKIASAVTLRFENGNIRCGIPGAPDAISPADGRAVDYTAGGETVKLSQRMTGGRLVQSFSTPEGSRTNTYIPSDDGNLYAMMVNISSPRLPTAVMYTLTYAKQR